MRTLDGRWLMMRLRPYRTVDDRIEGVVVTFVDITARREAEARVRESEARARALFETITEGLLFVDIRGEERRGPAGAVLVGRARRARG